MLNNLSFWMAERVVETKKINFEASSMKIQQYKSGLESRLKELKRKLQSAVSRPVVFIDHLKKLLASLGNGARSVCQA